MTACALRTIFVEVDQTVARLPLLPTGNTVVHAGSATYARHAVLWTVHARLNAPVHLIQSLLPRRRKAVNMRLNELASNAQALWGGPCSLVCTGIGARVLWTRPAALRSAPRASQHHVTSVCTGSRTVTTLHWSAYSYLVRSVHFIIGHLALTYGGVEGLWRPQPDASNSFSTSASRKLK